MEIDRSPQLLGPTVAEPSHPFLLSNSQSSLVIQCWSLYAPDFLGELCAEMPADVFAAYLTPPKIYTQPVGGTGKPNGLTLMGGVKARKTSVYKWGSLFARLLKQIYTEVARDPK